MSSKKTRHDNEPTPDGEDWVEWGGEPIWSAGFTEGGVPFGLTLQEFRKVNADSEPGAGWARAKHLLERVLRARARPRTTVEVGWVKKVGNGFMRTVFGAEVAVDPDPDALSGEYAVLLPGDEARPEDHARWRREPVILRQLAREELPFRVPWPAGVVPDLRGPVLIRRYLHGVAADLRAGRMPWVRPAELVGRIAAAVHQIPVRGWPEPPPGCGTQRAHGEEALRAFSGLEGAEIEDARAWAQAHLPPDRQACLIHGDMLGQNILLWPEERPAVIDWEFSQTGDPAYDLAIVTRGARRPFQMDRGLGLLLEAYAGAGGQPMGAAAVHFHELCLAARWYGESLAGRGADPPEQALARLRGILRRASAATG